MNAPDVSESAVEAEDSRTYGIALPVLLAILTLVLWFGFQTWQLVAERERLLALSENQAATYANARKMRAQLDAIAAGTAELARQGNANAGQVVQALQDKGITLRANDSAVASPKVR